MRNSKPGLIAFSPNSNALGVRLFTDAVHSESRSKWKCDLITATVGFGKSQETKFYLLKYAFDMAGCTNKYHSGAYLGFFKE